MLLLFSVAKVDALISTYVPCPVDCCGLFHGVPIAPEAEKGAVLNGARDRHSAKSKLSTGCIQPGVRVFYCSGGYTRCILRMHNERIYSVTLVIHNSCITHDAHRV